MPLPNSIFSTLFPYRAAPTTPAWNPDPQSPFGQGGGRMPMPTGSLADDEPPPGYSEPEADNFGWNSNEGYQPPVAEPTPVPTFTYPYPDPVNDQQRARNALAEGFWNYDHPKNRDKGVKGFLKELAQNFGEGLSRTPQGASVKQALLLGAAGAGVGLADRSLNEKRQAERDLPGLITRAKMVDEAALRDAQVANWEADKRLRKEQANNLAQYRSDTTKWHNEETQRKKDDRLSRDRTSRMNAVAGMFKNIPVYDPADPKFKELTEALGDVGLPLTPKDAKKKVDLKQDQRTGLWTVILTDPLTGKQEVRNVVKDGKPFTSTPTVVMQGEYGMLKQNDQQEFTAGENEKKRQFDVSLAGAKAQFQAAVKQFGAAEARLKAIDAFKRVFLNKTGKLPTDADINAYVGALEAPEETE